MSRILPYLALLALVVGLVIANFVGVAKVEGHCHTTTATTCHIGEGL